MNVLTQQRLRAGMSRTELAHLAGVSEFTIGAIERGSRKGSVRTRSRIAAVLRLHPNELQARVEEVAS